MQKKMHRMIKLTRAKLPKNRSMKWTSTEMFKQLRMKEGSRLPRKKEGKRETTNQFRKDPRLGLREKFSKSRKSSIISSRNKSSMLTLELNLLIRKRKRRRRTWRLTISEQILSRERPKKRRRKSMSFQGSLKL